MQPMNSHTSDFLESLLFVSDRLEGRTIFDFHPDFISAVDSFIAKFETFLAKRGFDFARLDDLQRSFGGNVFFSLSGHGCGFWDERDPVGEELDAHLETFAGRYRFEQIDLSTHRGGKIDLSIRVPFVAQYRARMFSHNLAE